MNIHEGMGKMSKTALAVYGSINRIVNSKSDPKPTVLFSTIKL